MHDSFNALTKIHIDFSAIHFSNFQTDRSTRRFFRAEKKSEHIEQTGLQFRTWQNL